jgi:short-subunit dehydrogenase
MERPIAVITGASAGMGAEFARQLAAKGYDLLLVARRLERLDALAAELSGEHPVRCETLALDLTIHADLAVLESRLRSDPGIAFLVNNAGFGTLGKFYKNPIESQDKMHRLHVMATMRLCHAALQGMIERDRGAIVNVSSIAGFVYGAGSVSYCATKAWMNRFTETLYTELLLSESRVRVQALCPGYTRTEFHETLHMDTGRIPPWMWLSAESVVRAALKGIDDGNLFVIPGWGYRVFLRIYTMLPQAVKHRLATRGPKYRKDKA